MRCSISVPENKIFVEDRDGSTTCIGEIDDDLKVKEPGELSRIVESRARDFADLGYRVSIRWGIDTDFATVFD